MKQLVKFSVFFLILQNYCFAEDAQNPFNNFDPNVGPSAVVPSKHEGVKLPEQKAEPRARVRKLNEVLQDKEFDKIWMIPFPDAIVESFDFPDAELNDIIKAISKLTRKNFVIDAKVSGKITIITQSPIRVRDAFKVFLTSLFANGWSIVETGEYLRVVRLADAREMKHPIIEGDVIPESDSMITKVLALKHVSSDEVIRNIRTLTNREARVFSLTQANTLIIVETASNMQRLLKIISLLDQKGHLEEPTIIPVNHAQASEIVKLLKSIIDDDDKKNGGRPRRTEDTGAQIGPKVKDIIADDRTNNLIVLANDAGLVRVKSIMAKIDIPAPDAGGKIHVYGLLHADAKKLGETMNKLLGDLQSANKTNDANRTNFRRALPPPISGTGSESEDIPGKLQGEVKIAADEETNSLIITAAPSDYKTVEEVLQKLDVPRDQVFVEAIVMEMLLSNGLNYGINYAGATGESDFNRAAFVPEGSDVVNFLSNPLALGGFAFGFSEVGKAREIKVGDKTMKVRGINGVIKAIQSVTDSNIRATPSVLTLDNQSAEIKVVNKVPVEKAVAGNGTSPAVPTTDFIDVGLTMKIKPNINKASDVVKLEVEFGLEDFSEIKLPSALESKAIATNKREAKTIVNVKDNDTIVIGGLIRERVNKTRKQIPFLGDIPILGWLFRSYSTSNEKTNLLVFLTPRVIKHSDRLLQLKQEQLLERDNFISKHRGGEEPFPEMRAKLSGGQTPSQPSNFSSGNEPTPSDSSLEDSSESSLLQPEGDDSTVEEVPPSAATPPSTAPTQNANNSSGDIEGMTPPSEAPADPSLPEF